MKENLTEQTNILPDEEIIELYWKRNEQAIQATDDKYHNYLYTIAYNVVHDRLDCEECLNDTYLGTWNSIPPKRPNVFQAFLAKLMRNIAVDRFRKNTAYKRIPSEMLISLEEMEQCMPQGINSDNEVAVNELGALLNGFLRSLSAREQFIFICRYYYADSVTQIASMLKLSEVTVYRDLKQARALFVQMLREEGYRYE